MTLRSIQNPMTKWIKDQCKDVKLWFLIGGLIYGATNLHYARTAALETVLKDQIDLRKDVEQNAADIKLVNRRITTETVTKDEFKTFTTQFNVSVATILQGQQQLYNLVVFQSRTPAPERR